MTTITIAVPRSGSAITSTQKASRRMPIGRHMFASVRGAGRLERWAAAHTASASFASSEGWNVAGPSSIQRRAPLTRVPTTSTARHRKSAERTSVGAITRSPR